MLDYFAIATRGGIILWSKTFVPLVVNPTDALIENLIKTTMSEDEPFYYNDYQVNWTTSNDFGLIFIAVCQKILQLNYIHDLLLLVKKRFIDQNLSIFEGKRLSEFNPNSIFFEDTFDQLHFSLENRGNLRKKIASEKPKAFEDTKKFQKSLEGSKRAISDLTYEISNKSPSAASTTDFDGADFNLVPRRKGAQMRAYDGKKNKKNSPKPENPESKSSKAKAKRIWDDGTARKELMKDLDFSNQTQDSPKRQDSLDSEAVNLLVDESNMGRRSRNGTYELAELSESDTGASRKTDRDAEASSSITGRVGTFFKNLTSGVVLTEKDLAAPITKIREHLVSKNVASEIATNISDSVQKELIGARAGGLQRISALIYPAMEKTLTRILTPSTSTDMLTEINHIRVSQKRPYSIVFVGVNGVGKSTNLSKVCFWLLQNNFRVLIAACDTFRSGAVEQLRVHVNNLRALSPKKANVDIFERGYGKDSAAIAKEAITHAESNGYDVVLIDTAGRMQDNEPLMRALAKLVSVNNPDKVLFVGEALVGNEAVKQLTKFNQALLDHSIPGVNRTIDGIILSKFDTIDDKVGAALTMTFITGKPILFVGTGQTYTDLKNVKISSIVDSLLKD